MRLDVKNSLKDYQNYIYRFRFKEALEDDCGTLGLNTTEIVNGLGDREFGFDSR
jgi:hypothetical protein